MNFRQINYFLTVVEYMNITKAAKSLYVSQQALSEQIQKLEEEFGKPLFIRNPRLRLTDAGTFLYEKARELAEIETQLINGIHDLGEQYSGTLTIGIGRTLGLKILPIVLPDFSRHYPNVKIVVKQGGFLELSHWLEEGEVDILISSKPRIYSNIEITPLFEEGSGLIVPTNIMQALFPENTEKWAEKFKHRLDISQFSDAPFLIYNERNHVYTRCLYDNGISPKIVAEINDTETLFQLAKQGMGVCFCSVPGRTIPEGLYCFPVDKNVLSERIVIARRQEGYMTNSIRAFIAHTERCCKTFFEASASEG